MKIGGIDPKGLCNEVILVLPRGDQELVFRARGLSDMDEFQALCPAPKPTGKMTKDGWVPNLNDPTYQQMMSDYADKRLAYLMIKSLVESNIEWDVVNINDPRTWVKWQDELKGAGLSQVEINRIVGIVMEANCLDEVKLKKAREVFLLGQAPMPAEFSGPLTAPASTQSGAPVSV